jgi:hypothetical protein
MEKSKQHLSYKFYLILVLKITLKFNSLGIIVETPFHRGAALRYDNFNAKEKKQNSSSYNYFPRKVRGP